MLVHNHYKEAGGEDKVVKEELLLLKSRGINVSTFFVNNDDLSIDSITKKIKLGFNTIWSKEHYQIFREKLKSDKPDIVHFHNTFPRLSPSVYFACKYLNIPVIQTLHNYRLACPGALFMRGGSICEKCLSGSLFNSIRYGCYRDSRLQTIPLTAMLYTHRILKTWNNKVDRYIALSEFSKRKFIETGINADNIVVKPNFIESAKQFIDVKEDYIVFVGRLSKEKGVHLLLEAWKSISKEVNTKLRIIGDGPEHEFLVNKYKNINNVEFLGKMNSASVLAYVSKAKYLVLPSLSYEGFPMTIVEAYSVNTPVIATNIGSLKEIVTDEVTGFHFKNKNIEDLCNVVIKALKYHKYDYLIKNIQIQFNEKYTAEKNFQFLMKIYNDVLEEQKNEK